MTTNSKPTVRFTGEPEYGLYQGDTKSPIAWVNALDHPVWGEEYVRTSRILKLNEDGSFETLNTLYVPS